MMYRYLLALFIVTGTLLTGCGHMTNSAAISTVDSLSAVLNAVESELNRYDKDKLSSYLDSIEGDVRYIYNNFDDTLDRETTIIASDYSRLRKSIAKTMNAHTQQVEELKYSKAQLESLRTDLVNNKINGGTKKIPEYLEQESAGVEKLSGASKTVMGRYDGLVRDFERLHPQMGVFMDSLKSIVAESNRLN